MDAREHLRMTDRPCPLAFVVIAAFATSLVWVCAMLGYLPVP